MAVERPNGKCAVTAWNWNGVLAMNVRPWLGDVGLAVLLALPTATLANPSAILKSRPTASTPHLQLAAAGSSISHSRLGLPG